jgi:PEP-CTERM motif-containing protein
MIASPVRPFMAYIFILALLMVCSGTFAQGTVNGPYTTHSVNAGLIAMIGTPANPIPIDLDPLSNNHGWEKRLLDTSGGLLTTGSLIGIDETMVNVGTEAWTGWHELMLEDEKRRNPVAAWTNIFQTFSVTVNGNPIGFNVSGFGTTELWIDSFSQPVLPGDVLNIYKVAVLINPRGGGLGGFMTTEGYPTPEPGSLGLMGLGVSAVIRRR